MALTIALEVNDEMVMAGSFLIQLSNSGIVIASAAKQSISRIAELWIASLRSQ